MNRLLKFVNKKETFVHIFECESEGSLSSAIHNYNRRKTKVTFVFFFNLMLNRIFFLT